MRQAIHAQPTKPQRQQTKKAKRPLERQEQVDEGRGVERHRVPLREERHATIAIRIPKRQLSVPKTRALEISRRIGKKPEVTGDESLPPKQNLWVSDEHEQSQPESEPANFEPIIARNGPASLQV